MNSFKRYHMEICFWIMAVCSITDTLTNIVKGLS
jgi:hypothetical protein